MMTYPGLPRRPGGPTRWIFLAIAIILILGFIRHHHLGPDSSYLPSSGGKPAPVFPSGELVAPIEPETKTPATQYHETKVADTKLSETKVADTKLAETKVADIKLSETKAPVAETSAAKGPATASSHPIDALIQGAENSFAELLKKESKDLKSAAAEYRKRRGRHPPPGFDTWFKFAQDNDAVMVEDFFDQIYHDLGPFWGIPASTMRKESWDYEMTLHIRGHNATAGSTWFWTQIWLNLTKTIEHMLPDMSLPLNAMDEPRIVAPWEEVNEYMEIERSTRSMAPVNEVVTEFQRLELPGYGPDKDVETRPKEWEETRKS